MKRIVPRLVPRFRQAAQSVSIKQPEGWWGPAATYELKYVTTTGRGFASMDLYAFCLDDNIQAMMTIYYRKDLDLFVIEIARFAWSAQEIYLEGILEATFPPVPDERVVTEGYICLTHH